LPSEVTESRIDLTFFTPPAERGMSGEEVFDFDCVDQDSVERARDRGGNDAGICS
jgi:hypothetical protein